MGYRDRTCGLSAEGPTRLTSAGGAPGGAGVPTLASDVPVVGPRHWVGSSVADTGALTDRGHGAATPRSGPEVVGIVPARCRFSPRPPAPGSPTRRSQLPVAATRGRFRYPTGTSVSRRHQRASRSTFVRRSAPGRRRVRPRVRHSGRHRGRYVWDYADGMAMMRHFWDAATTLDPGASELDEGRRFRICQPGPLEKLWTGAGLKNVAVRSIDVETVSVRFRRLLDAVSRWTGPGHPRMPWRSPRTTGTRYETCCGRGCPPPRRDHRPRGEGLGGSRYRGMTRQRRCSRLEGTVRLCP
jgi:hypothetical protein